MKTTAKFLAMFALVATMGASMVKAQGSMKVTADLVSTYYWRGVGAANAAGENTVDPHFQPTLAYVNGGFEIGAWGSHNFSGNYKEVDLYASYAISFLKLTVTDYNWNFKHKYFDFNKDSTDHVIEGSLAFTGTSALPLTLSVNTMIYGADKKATDATKQAYSTYIELGYTYKDVSFFLGATPADGYYGDGYGKVEGFSVCNIGASSSKSLKITDSYTLPIKATLGFNPQKEDAYLVFGITF